MGNSMRANLAVRSLGWCLLSLLVAAGCGGASTPSSGDSTADGFDSASATDRTSSSAADWPSTLLTNERGGPALYLGSEVGAPAVGYISEGVPVELLSGPEGGRVRVRIRGPLKVQAWLAQERLATLVQKKGRPRGTPSYVVSGNLVDFLGTDGSGLARIGVRPALGQFSENFIGDYPLDRLDVTLPSAADDVEAGTPFTLPPGQPVKIYDRPDGDVVATLPAQNPPLVIQVVRDDGAWKAVRAGAGPYLVGFVNAPLTAGGVLPTPSRFDPNHATTGTPERLTHDGDKPLLKVAAGTRVSYSGQTIAELTTDGWAREMTRYESGEIDAFVAIDNGVAIRGMIPAASVTPVQ